MATGNSTHQIQKKETEDITPEIDPEIAIEQERFVANSKKLQLSESGTR